MTDNNTLKNPLLNDPEMTRGERIVAGMICAMDAKMDREFKHVNAHLRRLNGAVAEHGNALNTHSTRLSVLETKQERDDKKQEAELEAPDTTSKALEIALKALQVVGPILAALAAGELIWGG